MVQSSWAVFCGEAASAPCLMPAVLSNNKDAADSAARFNPAKFRNVIPKLET